MPGASLAAPPLDQYSIQIHHLQEELAKIRVGCVLAAGGAGAQSQRPHPLHEQRPVLE